jgi:glucose-6-phosphate isomerase, archaeal
MTIDVSSHTGFDLFLDPDTLELEAGNRLKFKRATRKAKVLMSVLQSPNTVSPDTDMYHVYYLEDTPDDLSSILDPRGLTYSAVLLPPQIIGREYVKTNGHYHPLIPGTSYGYPEVYTQLYGRLLLLLQKRNRADPGSPEDCVLIDMVPGVTVTIPPDYAHVLINPTNELALMAGLYNGGFKPDYGEIRQQRGLAYYILDSKEDFEIVVNPLYSNPPPLHRQDDLTGTFFAPPDPGVPLWKSFLENPNTYSFLTEPEEVENHFNVS